MLPSRSNPSIHDEVLQILLKSSPKPVLALCSPQITSLLVFMDKARQAPPAIVPDKSKLLSPVEISGIRNLVADAVGYKGGPGKLFLYPVLCQLGPSRELVDRRRGPVDGHLRFCINCQIQRLTLVSWAVRYVYDEFFGKSDLVPTGARSNSNHFQCSAITESALPRRTTLPEDPVSNSIPSTALGRTFEHRREYHQ